MTLMQEFVRDAPAISDTRTFARACGKVEDQVKLVVSKIKEVIAASSSSQRRQLTAEVEVQHEALVKVSTQWKQTGLALGKNLHISPSPSGSRKNSPGVSSLKASSVQSSRVESPLTSSGKRSQIEEIVKTESVTPSSPKKKSVDEGKKGESPRQEAVVVVVPVTPSKVSFSLTLAADEEGGGSSVLVAGHESIVRAKQLLLDRAGFGERHHKRYQLRGLDSVLLVGDEESSLEKVPWIALCLRVGVVPQLQMGKRSDVGSEEKTLARWMSEEETLFFTLKTVLSGSMYLEGCVSSSGLARARLGLSGGSLLLLKAIGTKLEDEEAASGAMSDKWFSVSASLAKDGWVVGFTLVDGNREIRPEIKGTNKQQSCRLLLVGDVPPSSVLRITVKSEETNELIGWCNVACVENRSLVKV
jgi:hypothetical protein